MEYHKTNQSSAEKQDKVTQQSERFSSLMQLHEYDKANRLSLKQLELVSSNQSMQSGCEAKSFQSNMDTKKSQRCQLMCKNKNQLVPSSMIFLSLSLILTSNTMMCAEANDISINAHKNEIVRTNTKATRRTDAEKHINVNETQRIEKEARQ